MAVRKSAEGIKAWCESWTHSMAIPSPLDTVLGNTPTSSELVLPESVRSSDSDADGAGFGFPCSPFIGGSMELMAVPRKKEQDGKEDEVKKKQKTSKVWLEFSVITMKDGIKKIQCNHYNTKLAFQSTGSTSHLNRHMLTCSVRLASIFGKSGQQALICASDWIRNNYKLGHYNGLTVPLADEKGESSKSSMHN